jgi:polysaccharide export outer membrane protein
MVDPQPGLVGSQQIGLDGGINLPSVGRLRVEGLSTSQIARQVADLLGLPAPQIHVRVAEFKSQQIYLFGQVVGFQRAVAYQGPERIVDVLRRVGGITHGAAPGAIYVVRPGIMEGCQPQVFHVDLKAILVEHNQRTNIRVHPCDQVFVGETRPFSFEKCIPPILRPLYEIVCGLREKKG